VVGNYVPSNKQTNHFASGSQSTQSYDGLDDPSVIIAIRALDETKNSPVYLDLHASYAPNWVKAKSFSSTEGSGTVSRGGESGNLEVELSKKMNRLILEGFAGGGYSGVRKIYSQIGNGYFREDSYFNYYAGTNVEEFLSNRFAVNAGAQYTFSNQNNIDERSNDGTEENFRPGGQYIFNAGFNYSLLPKNALIEVYYHYAIYNNSHLDYPAFPTFDATTKNENNNMVGAAFRYVF